jgi:S-formylglutathione hydrolase FrmB
MENKAVLLKIFFLLALMSTLGIVSVFAQEQASVREDLWVCPVFETSFYSLKHPAFGGGAAFGYGNRVSFGLKAIYSNDLNGVNTLELNLLVRLYLFGLFRPKAANSEEENANLLPNVPRMAGSSGLYVQFNSGPVIFAQNNDNIAMPSEIGAFSVGLSVGWRFLLGRFFFIEPALRGGYPYIIGAGLSAGIRF